MKKKLLALSLALALGLALTACGEKQEEMTVLKVAASTTPHAEILAQVKDDLAKEGIDLQVTEYSDYVIPNTAVEDGDEDVNYFQHQPYLDQFNTENGTHLVSVAAIHYEPLGIYPGKTTALADLPDGATIGVPNDATNEARALQLLEAQGLITVREDAGLNATPNDIVDNPKNLDIVELEAAQLPIRLADLDVAVINGNYAIDAGLKMADALAIESAEGEAATAYVNVLAVKEGNEENEAVKALVEALQSDEVKKFMEDTYAGAVVPVC